MPIDNLPELIKSRYKHTSSFYSGAALMLVDGITVMLCFGASFFIINFIDPSLINFKSFITYWVYLPAFLIVFYAMRLYPGIMLSPADEIRRFTVCSACCFTGIALSIEIETEDRTALSIAMLLAIPIASILLPVGREVARKCFSRFFWWGVPAVIYYKNHDGEFIIDRLLKRPEFGYRPAVIISAGAKKLTEYKSIPVVMPSDAVHNAIIKLGIKTAIVIESKGDNTGRETLGDSIMNFYRYTIFIPYSIMSTVAVSIRDFGGILGFASTHNLTKPANLFMKRIIDLLLVLVSAPLALIFTAAIALTIKFSSSGTIFYGHKRIGKWGRPFTTWKFRTMVVDAGEQLETILASSPEARREWEQNHKLENDPRITPLGKYLRKTSLDELPQLWNILLGQMSFVGPRPVTEGELKKYGDKEKYILSVKPGLSGMWQISGRSDTGYEERIMLDSYYIQNWSIWLDIWIIIKTAAVVLNSKGAY
ncbi:MAG: undecaprenyl-phosphate galactose phosphotransferase WbaP [Treponema sp.]|jgi:Undecaprenyl-phosphate galactose phosphotransferase WbaP|nr:undecaprenyl-phosphate galactose phosphotransferase WbaP [Treponema sp.]